MQLLPMLVTALQESQQSQLLKKYGATLAKHTETASTLLDMLNLVLDDKARLNKNSYLAGTGRAMAVRSEVNGLLDIRACCREVKIPNQYGGVILWCLFMYRIDP